MASGIGNAVFLSNVDDFVSPSQACVNPLYGGNETTPPPPAPNTTTAITGGGGVVQKRQKRRGQTEEIVTATLADCLACSGCVTTAETVLLQERHNISKLVAALEDRRPILLTLSPAARADWERTHGGALDITAWRRYLGVIAVVDGNVPLQWSRETAVDEFVRAWKQRSQRNSKVSATATSVPITETWERDEVPSKALGEQKTEYYVAAPAGATTAPAPTVESQIPQLRTQQQLPILSSSCPAIVCYMETSHHGGVSHLSVAASPMAVAASAATAASVPNLFHVAVQPCHDKKLEAGRLDFSTTVDLVLTTSEWDAFVQERIATMPSTTTTQPAPPQQHSVRTPAQLQHVLQTAATASASQSLEQQPQGILCVAAPEEPAPTPSNNNDPALFLAGSGRYADTIFRQATQRIFGVDSVQPHWIQPGASRRRTRSREHYEATLYRRTRDGSLTSHPPTAAAEEEEATVIWRFAIVYGMQTVQRLLSSNDDWKERYDYMEVMACAGSCLNGAGQQRNSDDGATTASSSTAPGVETPAVTRERLAATRSHFRSLPLGTDAAATVDPCYTTYHIVPPLQHALGAAAGVAVQDTQW